MGVTINNESTTQNHSLRMDSSLSHWGDAFYWYQIFALDSAVVEVQETLSLYGLQCIIMEIHSNQINTPWWNKEKDSRLTDSES